MVDLICKLCKFLGPLNWAERPIDAPDNCSPDISCLLNVDHLLLKPENKPYSGDK